MFRRVKMMRQWGGIVDNTPDRSAIQSKTPVPGLYVNCGWGTGGFKATPGSANLFAHLIARDEPHKFNAELDAGPFPQRLTDRRGGGGGGGALMWTAALLAIGIDGAAMPAGDVFPGAEDFRLQKIHRAA